MTDKKKEKEEKDGEKVPTLDVPGTVNEIKMSEKDMEQLTMIDGAERAFQQGCAQLVRGLLKLSGDNARIESSKGELAKVLQNKYEIPEKAQWAADADTGMIRWQLPKPALAPEVQ